MTAHLGFTPCVEEHKVMTLAADGRPRFLDELRQAVRATGDGGCAVDPVGWDNLVGRRPPWGDEPRDALDALEAAQVDLLVLGPFVVSRIRR